MATERIRHVTADTTQNNTGDAIVFNSATGITFTLLPATNTGRKFRLMNIGAKTVTISPYSGDTINNMTSFYLPTYGEVVISDVASGTWFTNETDRVFGREASPSSTTSSATGVTIAKNFSDSAWTTGLKINDNASTTGIDIGTCTTDISLQNSATLDNSSDGTLTITEPTIALAASTKVDVNGMLDVLDEVDGGASTGSIIKKTLQAGEAYTGTTAGLMVKNYCEDDTVTVPSGEFTGLYVNLKGLHTDPGNNTSLISAHVHGSNTTTVHAGLWLYGDMTNGVKASGSTLTSMIDISEATAVTNLVDLPAAGTAPVGSGSLDDSGDSDILCDNYITVDVDGTAHYIPLYNTVHT